MRINNPYLYHPHPFCRVAADDLRKIISSKSDWENEFGKGKMLGVLIVEPIDENCGKASRVHYLNDNGFGYLAAYSGIVAIDDSDVFVPPVYDLNNPDDFYKEEEKNISAINQRIRETEDVETIEALKAERKQRSVALQIEIFKHFNFTNHRGETKNIIEIFAEAKRGLPPGGAGECAAPRLLQYAFTHNLRPIAMAEFWYGVSPKKEIRLHRQFYPSCIEKCSPILKWMLPEDSQDTKCNPSTQIPKILFEDNDIIILDKPSEVLSTPAKDTSLFNVESWLHETHPEVKGPMLVHRLDQSTSGLMIAAKNALAFKTLQQGFVWHTEKKTENNFDNIIQKTYHAWVEGNLPSECGIINLPICPNPDDRPRQVVDRQFGKTAVTRYKVLRLENIRDKKKDEEGCRTLLALYPLTGRTHQLRLHCSSPFGLDHPIENDRIYSFTDCKQPLRLRAVAIKFQHPTTKENLHFEAGCME